MMYFFSVIIKRTFHKAFYALVRLLAKIYFAFSGYTYIKYRPKSRTYLVLGNHNTDWDFMYAGIMLKKQMYFVVSEHIFRKGFTGRLIKFLVDPIPRKKGASGAEASRKILERLKQGCNVGMFAEGNRSYAGTTCFISPNTAKLVKQAGCGLVNIAIHGGYFVSPRWSKSKRRGPVRAEVVKEYTPEELALMTEDEVYTAIKEDLFVDAYADQKNYPVKYRGKNLAEYLETTLFYCPKCKSFSSMHSSGNEFFCSSCGMKTQIDEYGYFDKHSPFKTVKRWYREELTYLKNYVNSITDSDTMLFKDENIKLSLITSESDTLIDNGTMSLFSNRLEFTDKNGKTFLFNVADITRISVVKRDRMLFTCNDLYYEVMTTDRPYSALKYVVASRYLIGKDYTP